MNSINDLLDMICTEAVEYTGVQEVLNKGGKLGDLPPIHYALELIENSDGTLDWKE